VKENFCDDEKNIKLYSELVEKFGIDIRSLNWGSRASQELRFSILSHVGKIEGATILDVGCGLGDFYEWLTKNNKTVEYSGIDITPKMIEIARQRFLGVDFHLENLLRDRDLSKTNTPPEYDFILASGIFAHRQNVPMTFLENMVTEMFRYCRKAVAFNSLSAWCEDKEEGEFYADPLDTLKYCRSITPWVTLRHDYHPRDFTIYMYKERNV